MNQCPFCSLLSHRVVAESSTCLAIRDGFPISAGHTLIIPKRHVSSALDLDERELGDMMKLVRDVCDVLDKEHSPDGYNIGVNNGEAAGQTVMHVHMHIIPRYNGDIDEPRGGIRWILPDKAEYWSGES